MSEASDVGNATSVGELSAVTDPYNLSLQIGGIFIIIATSFLGMGLSLVFGTSWIRHLLDLLSARVS